MTKAEKTNLPKTEKKSFFGKIFKKRPKYDAEGNLIYYKKKKLIN